MRSRPVLLFCVAIAFCLVAAPASLAQEFAQTELLSARSTVNVLPPEMTFSKRVDEVNLLFTVTDGRGRFVSKLGESDFQILDNGVAPEKVRFFQQESDLPLHVILLIDVSGSVAQRFRFEQRAATTFFRKILRPGTDKAGVIAFDEKVHIVEDMTSDVPALVQSLKNLQPGGQTALFDAVVLACERLHSTPDPTITRRSVIVISDGDNNYGKALLADAQQAAARAETPIFALSTNELSTRSYTRGEAVLELLTRHSGGYILPARTERELHHAFQQVELALRNQYIVGYKPAEFNLNGRYRTIEVTARRRGCKVRSRHGYFAPRER